MSIFLSSWVSEKLSISTIGEFGLYDDITQGKRTLKNEDGGNYYMALKSQLLKAVNGSELSWIWYAFRVYQKTLFWTKHVHRRMFLGFNWINITQKDFDVNSEGCRTMSGFHYPFSYPNDQLLGCILTIHTWRSSACCPSYLTREARTFHSLWAFLYLVLIAASVGGNDFTSARLYVHCGERKHDKLHRTMRVRWHSMHMLQHQIWHKAWFKEFKRKTWT